MSKNAFLTANRVHRFKMYTFRKFLEQHHYNEMLGLRTRPREEIIQARAAENRSSPGKHIIMKTLWKGHRTVSVSALCRNSHEYMGSKLIRWVIPPLGEEEEISPRHSFESWDHYVSRICSK